MTTSPSTLASTDRTFKTLTHDTVRVSPVSFSPTASWVTVPGSQPLLVSHDRLAEEMHAFGAIRLNDLSDFEFTMVLENLRANPIGAGKQSPDLIFHEWVRCEPEGMSPIRPNGKRKADLPEFEAVPYDPTTCISGLRHSQVKGVWGHLVPDEPRVARVESAMDEVGADDGQEDMHGIRPTAYESEVRQDAMEAMREAEQNGITNAQMAESSQIERDADHGAFRIIPDSSVPENEIHFKDDTGKVVHKATIEGDLRAPIAEAGAVKNLADGVKRVAGFEEALRDKTLGHKAIAEMFSFTSETSVRRWRAKEGVVLA